MPTKTTATFLEKIEAVEETLQSLKVEAYFNLPQKKQAQLYPQASLLNNLRKTRKAIWQERYAGKV